MDHRQQRQLLSNLLISRGRQQTALEAFETTFHQDLNGDGTIGLPTIVIQTDGSTALTEVGNNFFLDTPVAASGPELKLGGAAVTPVSFAAGRRSARSSTGGGYDVAWKIREDRSVPVWSTDSNGNYLSNLIADRAGEQHRAGIARDHLPPGPQWRRHHRACHDGDPRPMDRPAWSRSATTIFSIA